MSRRLIAVVVGLVTIGAAVVVTLVAWPSGANGPSPGEVVQKLGTVRTCAQLRSLSTATGWHVFNTLGPEPCENDDMADGFGGLTFKIQSTQTTGDTAYVVAVRLCHRKVRDPGCNGRRFFFTLMKVDGAWKIDDTQWQIK